MIPKIILGTSPFLGAGQFIAAREYARRFQNPETVREIIAASYKMGIKGLQLLPYPNVMKAYTNFIKAGNPEMVIAGSLRYEGDGLEELKQIHAKIIMIHAAVVDRLNEQRLAGIVKEIQRNGAIPGIATHNPNRTLPAIETLNVMQDIKVVMLPFNKIGYMIKNLNELEKWIKQTNKFVIAKKVLAAGRLKVDEALNWVFEKEGVDAVAIGIASIEEAEETFSHKRLMAFNR